jgi:hypothetical protein
MSYDPEKALLAKLIEEKDLHVSQTRGLLSGKESVELYDWLVDKFETHGKVPSIDLVREHFPSFSDEDTEDSFEALLDTIREKKLYAELQQTIKRVASEAKISAKDGLESLKEEASKLSVDFSNGGIVDAIQSGAYVLRYYKHLKKKKGLLGISWPWPALNQSTRGIRPGSFNVLYGSAGVMKTWLLIYIAEYAHLQGYVPLFFTQEMPIEDIQVRHAALRSKINYNDFQSGALSAVEEKRFIQTVKEMKDDPPFLITELESTGKSAITEIRSKAKDSRANLILIDGLSFVPGSIKWDAFADACMGLKTLSRKSRIPIVASHHASKDRKGVKAQGDNDALDVALGDTLSRNVDNLFRLFCTMQDRNNKEIGIFTRKVREGLLKNFYINAIVSSDFSQKYTVNEDNEMELPPSVPTSDSKSVESDFDECF